VLKRIYGGVDVGRDREAYVPTWTEGSLSQVWTAEQDWPLAAHWMWSRRERRGMVTGMARVRVVR